jgi:hypothetical protein
MSMNFSSGSTSVSGTVAAVGTFTPVKVNATSKSGEGVNNTVTLGTVPVNKTWRIIGAQLSHSAGADNSTASIQANSIKIINSNCRITTIPQNIAHSQQWNYEAAIQLSAGQTVTLVSSASSNTAATVQYIEEDA